MFKKIAIVVLVVVLLTGSCLSIMASRFESVIRPNVFIGPVPVGGLRAEEAKKKLRLWWEAEKATPIRLDTGRLKLAKLPSTMAEFGFALDDNRSVSQIPTDNFWEDLQRMASGTPPAAHFEPVFKFDEEPMVKLRALVAKNSRPGQPARVFYRDGKIERTYEGTSYRLDEPKFKQAVLDAFANGGDGELPIVQGPKSKPDEALDSITEVVSTFTTHFNSGQTSRSSNIQLASSKIDGVVLMPGERFSFNDTVGRRTVGAGFRLAPVYKNGEHDVGIGGGICQVSTTLYNAALFSNLKIHQRQNHSLPVPYVPLGRDATVDFGSIDLAFENTTGHPIAICRSWKPGTLTFTILGKKDPSLSVKIISGGVRAYGGGTKVVVDRSLPAGKTRVIERGSAGRAVTTWRLVYKDGKQVAKDGLGTSIYRGSQRVIVRGGGAAPKPATTPPAAPAPAAPAPSATGL